MVSLHQIVSTPLPSPTSSLASVDVPVKHLFKRLLGALLNDVSVTRHNNLYVPRVDALDALIEAGAVATAESVPDQSLQALDVSLCRLKAYELASQEPRIGPVLLGNARVLLGSREVENQVGLDQNAIGLVEEGELLVGVGVDVLVLKVVVKLGADGRGALGVGLEDDVKRLLADPGVVLGASLLGKAVNTNQHGGGEGSLPLRDEKVVLNVGRDDVAQVVAQGHQLGLDLGGQGNGREDSEGAR